MFKRSYRKMNKAGEEMGGPASHMQAEASASGSTDQSSQDSGNAADTDSNAESKGNESGDIDYKALYETMSKEKESLVSKNQESNPHARPLNIRTTKWTRPNLEK